MFYKAAKYLGPVASLLLLLTVSGHSSAATSPVGMAVYTETARDIYVAALKLPDDTILENIWLADGPKTMEYRIAIRRISSRAFAGTLLLQAELGSGERAPDNAIKALTQIKKKVKGALLQGDRFVIHLSERDTTSFSLNGVELLKVNDGSVFDFFFAGWAGGAIRGQFKDTLLAGSINPDIEARFVALEPASSRKALVAAWMAPPKPVSVPKAEPVAEPEPTPVATPVPEEPVQVAVAQATPETQVAAPTAAPQAETSAEPVEVAVVTEPASEAVELAPGEEPAPEEALPELDDREYQQQVAAYVTTVMTKVFGEVVYPRRAINRTIEGKVEMLAHLDSEGDLIDLSLDSSSGSTILDDAAQRAVRKAAPFEQLSEVAREEFLAEDGSYVVSIPVTFRLQ